MTSPLLASRTRLTAATVCIQGASAGGAVEARRLDAAQLSELTGALHLRSAPLRDVCDAVGTAPPPFVVEEGDGRWVHPDLPSDGCHPRPEVVATLVRLGQ